MAEDGIITTAGEQGPGTATAEGEGVAEGESPKAQMGTEESGTGAEATFTQSQVNDIVRERLARHSQSAYERYGVKDENGLDELVGKGQYYDMLREREKQLTEQVAQLSEELALAKNGIAPERYDDVRTWFKGKSQPLTEGLLKDALLTHGEWKAERETVSTATASPIGSPSPQGKSEIDENEIASKYFGLNSFGN